MSSASRIFPVRALVLCALFAALTAVCAQVIIPIGPVPVSLSLLPVLLCGALLPCRQALLAMAVYLLLGLAGAPVFSGFSGGPAKLFGVTGGYIIGYLPCVLAESLLLRTGRAWWKQALAMAAGVLLCYALGTAWFMITRHTSLMATLSACVLPFLPFDAVKIALAVILSLRISPIIGKLV